MHEYESERFAGLEFENQEFSDYHFTDCEFADCVISFCKFHHCHFSDCRFTGCRLSNNSTQQSRMSDLAFENCSIIGMNWREWMPVNGFSQSFDLVLNCHIKYNTFMEMNLTKFVFSGNDITDSLFGDCRLESSSFKGCNLANTEFFRCNLIKSDFRDAEGYKIDINTNHLKNAVFSLPEAVHLLTGLGIKIE